MGRPKKSNENKPTPANKQQGEKKCNYCHENKKVTDFYLSKNPIHSADGRVPICKDCVLEQSLNEDGTINILEFNRILKLIDRPYYKDTLETALDAFKRSNSYIEDDKAKFYGKEIIGKYFTLIALKQDRNKSYADSEKEGFIHKNNNVPKNKKAAILKKYIDINTADVNDSENENAERHYTKVDDSEITDEIRELFGDGFSNLVELYITNQFASRSACYIRKIQSKGRNGNSQWRR